MVVSVHWRGRCKTVSVNILENEIVEGDEHGCDDSDLELCKLDRCC